MTSTVLLAAGTVTAGAKPVHLLVEHRSNPLSIDESKPQLSWRSDDRGRNWMQSAWQVLVATDPNLLKTEKPDIWNSGRQEGSISSGTPYSGPALQSSHRYFWAVRVWDKDGHVTQSDETAWWEMGLLNRSDWKAEWIGWMNGEEEADEEAIHWIWSAGSDAANVHIGTEERFHLDFTLGSAPHAAGLFLQTPGGDWTLSVNGVKVSSKKAWKEWDRQEVGYLLKAGLNTLDVRVSVSEGWSTNHSESAHSVALAALLKVTKQDGTIERIGTNDQWKSAAGSNASLLAPVAVLGSFDDHRYNPDGNGLTQPAALLRKSFLLGKTVARARLYATALGTYELFLNGTPVTHSVLNPGFTDFSKRVQYQTYDVTAQLKSGTNLLGATVADGWYGSGLSWTAEHFVKKPQTRLLSQLDIDFTDGSHQTVGTDGSWQAASSPVVHSEIYAGETYDARLEQRDWNQPRDAATTNNGSTWTNVVVGTEFDGFISSEPDDPPQIVAHMKPETVKTIGTDKYIFDMGQNMVGWAALKISGAAPGTTVQLRFAEILNADGSIYTTNLRNADATDTFILAGNGGETVRPHFTFHGFRYVELTGHLPGPATKEMLTGEVISSVSGDPTASVTTSSELVNHMWKIGIWGQRGNFLSVPTDCPQRDERLGWMADAAVFWRTGSYNFDIAAFTNKWLRDVRDAQSPAGAFSNVSPSIGVGTIEGAPGWGDAGVIVPWTTWMQYGDGSVIERNWDAMERWMKFTMDANPDLVRRNKVGPNFADWLAPDKTTPNDLTDTAYWALLADMMTQMAHATGKDEAETRYAELKKRIAEAFNKAFVKSTGDIGSGSQTGYVLALQMKLLPPALEAQAVTSLVKSIERANNHLTTGFLGTPALLFSLADHGRTDVAYRLLLNNTYPSWGYMLRKGATTWWERWNGDSGDPAMNSYNHYAFGSVVAWIYQCVAGIDTTESGPGFHQILIHPRPGPDMTHAQGTYESAYGLISTDWKIEANSAFTLKASIPPNTTAQVILPAMERAGKKDHVTQDGKTIKPTMKDGQLILTVGSGIYEFKVN